jgi:hypothetical protein
MVESLQIEKMLWTSDFQNNINVPMCCLCPHLLSIKGQAYHDWLGSSGCVKLEKIVSSPSHDERTTNGVCVYACALSLNKLCIVYCRISVTVKSKMVKIYSDSNDYDSCLIFTKLACNSPPNRQTSCKRKEFSLHKKLWSHLILVSNIFNVLLDLVC